MKHGHQSYISESVNNNICIKELKLSRDWMRTWPPPIPFPPSSSCIPLVVSILESVIWLCYEHVSLDWQCIVIIVFTSCNCSLALIPGPGILYGSSLWLVLVLALMVFLGILQFSSLCKNHQCHSHYCFHCHHHHHHNSKKISLMSAVQFFTQVGHGWQPIMRCISITNC